MMTSSLTGSSVPSAGCASNPAGHVTPKDLNSPDSTPEHVKHVLVERAWNESEGIPWGREDGVLEELAVLFDCKAACFT